MRLVCCEMVHPIGKRGFVPFMGMQKQGICKGTDQNTVKTFSALIYHLLFPCISSIEGFLDIVRRYVSLISGIMAF